MYDPNRSDYEQAKKQARASYGSSQTLITFLKKHRSVVRRHGKTANTGIVHLNTASLLLLQSWVAVRLPTKCLLVQQCPPITLTAEIRNVQRPLSSLLLQIKQPAPPPSRLAYHTTPHNPQPHSSLHPRY